MSELNEAYVVGLLADLETKLPAIGQKLTEAQNRADAVNMELLAALDKQQAARDLVGTSKAALSELAAEIGRLNQRVVGTHRDIEIFQNRANDVKRELDRAPASAQPALRKAYAQLQTQLSNRQKLLPRLGADIDAKRDAYIERATQLEKEADAERSLSHDFEKLQALLPNPKLYVQWFDVNLGTAHAQLYLDHNVAAWKTRAKNALEVMLQLHRDLRLGKYRLDQNSELVGGRLKATFDAMCIAIVLDDLPLAQEFFALATDPNLYFHHIFNVFRMWCVGLYITGRRRELAELLRLYQYSEDLKGAYTQCFLGLLAKNPKMLTAQLRDVARFEWKITDDMRLERSLGIVNLGAVTICKLAAVEGLNLQVTLPTVPAILIGHAQTSSAFHDSRP
jgi:hypothetical protein